jgi:hypothetical protein
MQKLSFIKTPLPLKIGWFLDYKKKLDELWRLFRTIMYNILARADGTLTHFTSAMVITFYNGKQNCDRPSPIDPDLWRSTSSDVAHLQTVLTKVSGETSVPRVNVVQLGIGLEWRSGNFGKRKYFQFCSVASWCVAYVFLILLSLSLSSHTFHYFGNRTRNTQHTNPQITAATQQKHYPITNYSKNFHMPLVDYSIIFYPLFYHWKIKYLMHITINFIEDVQ